MTNKPSFETSIFLRRIKEKLNSLMPTKGRLRVSVADEPTWEPSNEGDEVLVRWACWSIEEDGKELVAPEFEVLSDKVTRQKLTVELPIFFPQVEVVVDNHIKTSGNNDS